MKNFLLISFAIFFLHACGNQETDRDWNNYKTPYFQIKYPEKFEFMKKGQHNEKGDLMLQQAEFFLYLDDTLSLEKDEFQANINLLIQDLSGLSYDLSRFSKDSENQISNLIKNAKIIESKTNKNHHRIKYSGELDGRDLFFYQHYELKNNQAYILTFSSAYRKFEAYLPVVDSVFSSFQIK